MYLNKMRKVSALFLATFYLMLSTGAFACIVHCTSVLIIADQSKSVKKNADNCDDEKADAHTRAGISNKHRHKKDDCRSGKNCNCCKKHGMYIVRENFDSCSENKLVHPLATLPPLVPFQYNLRNFQVSLPDHPTANSPPPINVIPIYLKVRSLLI